MVMPFHHLGDCDLYMPPQDLKGRQMQPGQNEELVPNRGTTSVAWTRIIKHCSLIQTDFKPLKHKQQSYIRALCLCERSVLFFRFIGFARLHKHLYASEYPSLQVSS